MRLLYALLLAMLWAFPLPAQNNEQEPLVVPFASFPPFLFLDEDGQRAGFTVDLIEVIAAEIGIPIMYLDVVNTREWVAAQATGQSHIAAGVAELPALAGTNVFSNEVALDELRPAVRADDQDLLAGGILENRRIAIVPPAVGAQEPILEQNIAVEFDTPQAALMELLSENVDAVLFPPPTIYDLARDARIDGRIAFMGDPLRTQSRHVAIHQSRAELLEPINDILAAMEADGRLESLRRKYNITLPPPPPEVLRVGVTHIPPLSIIEADGTFSGFDVDVMRAVAERAGLNIELVPLALTDWVQGPSANGLDAISALVINEDRKKFMEFTFPILERTAAVIGDVGETVTARQISDLVGQRVGTIEGSFFARRAAASGITDLALYDTNEAAIEGLMAGEADIALLAPDVAGYVIEDKNLGGRLQMVLLADETIDTSIALRPGLGAIREQMNTVIPVYLLSDDYAALRQTYFGQPVFWTPFRIYGALVSGGTPFFLLLGYLFWERQRQKRREFNRQAADLEREQRHSAELGTLVADLERSNRELDQFAYIASHDLKEPLRGIGINANFLMREELPSKAGERVLRMGELAGRMEKLISDLLFFSRLKHDTANDIEVEPSAVIADIRAELSEWLAERGGEIVEVSALPKVNADRVKLKTVLQNLVVNGIKYSDADNRRVEIGFAPEAQVNGTILTNAIFVKDNGIGIGAQYRDKVFRIFSRLNKESDYGEGTGSGLAFVRKIVEDYGGVIDFTSEAGKGSTFYFTLPLAQLNA